MGIIHRKGWDWDRCGGGVRVKGEENRDRDGGRDRIRGMIVLICRIWS